MLTALVQRSRYSVSTADTSSRSIVDPSGKIKTYPPGSSVGRLLIAGAISATRDNVPAGVFFAAILRLRRRPKAFDAISIPAPTPVVDAGQLDH
jgi:hypothetical protein